MAMLTCEGLPTLLAPSPSLTEVSPPPSSISVTEVSPCSQLHLRPSQRSPHLPAPSPSLRESARSTWALSSCSYCLESLSGKLSQPQSSAPFLPSRVVTCKPLFRTFCPRHSYFREEDTAGACYLPWPTLLYPCDVTTTFELSSIIPTLHMRTLGYLLCNVAGSRSPRCGDGIPSQALPLYRWLGAYGMSI